MFSSYAIQTALETTIISTHTSFNELAS